MLTDVLTGTAPTKRTKISEHHGVTVYLQGNNDGCMGHKPLEICPHLSLSFLLPLPPPTPIPPLSLCRTLRPSTFTLGQSTPSLRLESGFQNPTHGKAPNGWYYADGREGIGGSRAHGSLPSFSGPLRDVARQLTLPERSWLPSAHAPELLLCLRLVRRTISLPRVLPVSLPFCPASQRSGSHLSRTVSTLVLPQSPLSGGLAAVVMIQSFGIGSFTSALGMNSAFFLQN